MRESVMRSAVLGVLVTFLALVTGGVSAQNFDETLVIKLDLKDLYAVYDQPWPTAAEAGLSYTGRFYETGTGGQNSVPFQNKTGNMWLADQNQLTDLTITSAVDLYLNHPGEFAKYSNSTFATGSSASFSSALQAEGDWAVFFSFTVGNTYFVTPIHYFETREYSAQSENWSVGAGWDGATPFVFVNVSRRFAEFNGGPGNGGHLRGSEVWGLDVVEATAPRNTSELCMLLADASQPGGFRVNKLFPLQAHLGLIDGPIGSGCVVEPNCSINGDWVIFGYFHDVINNLTSSNSGSLPLKGADLYMINVAPLKADPSVDPATLTCHRLTSTLWNPGTGEQDLDDKNKKAQNPDLAKNVFSFDFRYGRIFMHGIHTKIGGATKLVFASNMRRLGNSNNAMDKSHYNLNLFEGKLNFQTGALTEVKQIHYFTTTSAMSPARMRDGFSFSYQSTTEDARSWEVQITRSNYQWLSGVGYGINGQEVLHLQTLANTTSQDWLVTGYYYNQNNNGFGKMVANPTATLASNVESTIFVDGAPILLPKQNGFIDMVPAIPINDIPSAVGKLAAPRAGRVDEVFASYSPYTSNDKDFSNGTKAHYDSYIVSFPDVDNRLASGGNWNTSELQLVLDDGIKWKSQIWGVPVLSHVERFGEGVQSSPPVKAITNVPYYQGNPAAIHGMPHAVIGTSALSNTDVKVRDARIAGYDLDGLTSNQIIRLQNNVAGLSKVLNNSAGLPDILEEMCQEHILGVAVHLTSNKPDASYSMDYQTIFGQQELTRLLGVYDVRNNPDDSFMATIPANQPIELQLIDREYGLKLADQRSWKSLKPGELRNDCGGCHNHVGAAVPFAGTFADGPSYIPEDMTAMTRYIEYDANCDPKTSLTTSLEPALVMPEYYDDVLPGLQAHCSSCHTQGGGGESAFNLDNPEQAYSQFYSFGQNKPYYNNDGALGSPLFWAARGKRTDNRDNNLFSNSNWKYSSAHDVLGLCDGTSLPNAQWVYTLGLWIDHMMPKRITAGPQPFDPKFDRYHPSVNFDLKLINNNPNNKDTSKLVVGYWDDSDFNPAGTLEIYVDDVLMYGPQVITSNGSVIVNISAWGLQNRDLIEAVIVDGEDNHQYYSKRYAEIKPTLQVYPADPLPAQPIGAGG